MVLGQPTAFDKDGREKSEEKKRALARSGLTPVLVAPERPCLSRPKGRGEKEQKKRQNQKEEKKKREKEKKWGGNENSNLLLASSFGCFLALCSVILPTVMYLLYFSRPIRAPDGAFRLGSGRRGALRKRKCEFHSIRPLRNPHCVLQDIDLGRHGSMAMASALPSLLFG